MRVTNKSDGNYVLAPEGLHKARCIAVVDTGTQANGFDKTKRPQGTVRISWELSEELHSFKEGEPARPFIVSKDYTTFLGDKAKLTEHLGTWRGKSLTEEEKADFKLKVLLGKPCQISIVHEAKDGKTKAKITAITQMPKEVQVPAQVNPSVYFDMDEYDSTVFAALPTFLQDKIKLSPEYQALAITNHMNGGGEDWD